MAEAYQELIKNIEVLKKNQKSRDEEIERVLETFEVKKGNFNRSCGKIEKLLKEIKEEVDKVEKGKKELVKAISFGSEKNERNDDENPLPVSKDLDNGRPYKKFFIRESLLTILLRKPTYQAFYNITVAFLILYAMIFVLNLYLGKASIDIESLTLHFYFTGITRMIIYAVIKGLLLIALVIIINLTGVEGTFIIPGLIIGIVLLIFRNGSIFFLDNFSSLVRFLHYWDNCNFILKIMAYYFEKKLYISYYQYVHYNNLPIAIEKNKTIVIKDEGDAKEIKFEWKGLYLLREIKNFFKFFYSPTLIYRDVYPTITRNISAMIQDMINCLLCIGLLYFMLEVDVFPLFNDINDLTSAEKVTSMLVTFLLYALLLLFVIIFCFVHSYSNFTSAVLCFGDKYFYEDFFNSKTPKSFFKKVAYIYGDFFEFYLIPLLRKLNLYKSNELLENFIKDLLTMLFFSSIFDYIIFSFIGTQSPIISLCLITSLVLSYPLEFMRTTNVYLVNWLIISLSIGLCTMVIISEEVIIENKMIDMVQLGFLERLIPKVFYLVTHPEKIIK